MNMDFDGSREETEAVETNIEGTILQAVPKGQKILPMQWPMPTQQRAKARLFARH